MAVLVFWVCSRITWPSVCMATGSIRVLPVWQLVALVHCNIAMYRYGCTDSIFAQWMTSSFNMVNQIAVVYYDKLGILCSSTSLSLLLSSTWTACEGSNEYYRTAIINMTTLILSFS